MLIFHKTVNRNKLKVRKFQSHKLGSFSAIKKTVTGVEGGSRGGGGGVSFLYYTHEFPKYIEFS